MTASTVRNPGPQKAPGAIPHTLSHHLCVDFVNSRFADHTGGGGVYDRLELADWRRWFVDRCGLSVADPPSPGVRGQLIELRNLLRRLLESGQLPDNGALIELNRFLSPAQSWQLSRAGPLAALTLRFRQENWHAVMATTVVSYGRLITTGGIHRIRVCGNPDCSFVFHDETRNRSRRWCDARMCGNLIKVRRHRGSRPGGLASDVGKDAVQGPRHPAEIQRVDE